ncbi:UNVERIFIED_CONTAM: hypothetical protein FKN15_017324 [Acipenser sinensis]
MTKTVVSEDSTHYASKHNDLCLNDLQIINADISKGLEPREGRGQDAVGCFNALFSRVTLTASPGATVKEGEALNLTCEAAVNKTPRPELHYTIVRDGEPVTNSTDSALYSIASTEKSHTGSYTCAVESQGVKKSSQELHIEVQTSWQSAAAAAGFSVGFFVILLLIVFTLLLLYHKIRGVPCITGGKSSDTWRGGECGIIAEVKLIKPGVSHYCHRERSDQNQDQAAGGVELSSQAQQPGCISQANPQQLTALRVHFTGKPTADNAESMYATVLPKKKRKEMLCNVAMNTDNTGDAL